MQNLTVVEEVVDSQNEAGTVKLDRAFWKIEDRNGRTILPLVT